MCRRRQNWYAIGGLKNSGKDVSAKMLNYCLSAPKMLRTYWGYKHLNKFFNNYKILSFATSLKQTLSAMINVPVKYFNDRNFKENNYIFLPTLTITKTPDTEYLITDNKFNRMINKKDLSFLKTNYISIRQLLQVFGTNIAREFFGDRLWILSTLKSIDNVIISDLRFNIEYEELKQRGFKTIYINRKSTSPGLHNSEKEVYNLYKNKKFDVVINNNGNLKDLFNSIKKLV